MDNPADPAKPLVAAAQYARTAPWKPNADGSRTVEEAIGIAKRHGVKIPDDVRIVTNVDEAIPLGAEAIYGGWNSELAPVVRWTEFYLEGMIHVKVRTRVLESDEAIVAVLAHEMHEIFSLRRIFEASGGMMAVERLHSLVSSGIAKNLHDEAWDVADKLVEAMRRD